MKKPILKTLSSGLRILLIPEPQAPTLTAMVLVGVGSEYEAKEQSGLSHFLEHLYFKGTLKRPSAKIISETLDRIGAISNAFTSEEYTGYWAKGAPHHLDVFLDVLSDIYLNSTFPDIELNKEKGVVIEEINMYEDMPQYIVEREMTRLLHGDQPAGRPVIGSKETVQSFTRDHVLSFQRAHYGAPNTVIVVSGAFDTRDTVRKIATLFKSMPTQKKRKKPRTKSVQTLPAVLVYPKQTDQAHIALSFRSVPLGHPDIPPLRLLSAILGRSMSSRLFLRLREELGAAYYVNAGQDSGTDHGEFGIHAGIDKNRIAEIVSEIVKELTKMKEEAVSIEELSKAREYSLGMLRLGLESTDDLANFYGYAAILGQEMRTPESIEREYTAVTPRDIQKVAQKYFLKKKANLVIVGAVAERLSVADIFDSL